MAAPSGTATSPYKFDPFTINSTNYKTVNEHPINVDVLVPTNLEPGETPPPRTETHDYKQGK